MPITNVVLPINWDIFTNIVIEFVNQLYFQDFFSTLDSSGCGNATFIVPSNTGLVGLNIYFAYGLVNPMGKWDFASNAISVKIVP